MEQKTYDDRGLLQALLGDGRPLLLFCGLSLVLAGGFALFLSASKHFLPHDVQYLGMTAEQLCGIKNCRVVYFMFHDRVAFGGALIAIGALYMWLAEFPLRQRKAWAWWLFVVSGISGFGSFLAYLGYGYPGHVARPCNLTTVAMLHYRLGPIASAPGSAARNSVAREIGSAGQLAVILRSWPGASTGDSGRHDCRGLDCDDLWHDSSFCATRSDIHGLGKN